MWKMKRWPWLLALPLIVLGLIFILVGMKTDPAARTEDGYSLKWFWYIMGLWFIGLTLLVYAGIYYFIRRSARKVERYQKSGIKGYAVVLSSGATGTEMNNMPRVEMELRVEPEGSEPYEVTHREFVNPVNLASLRSGARVPVLVDPADRKSLMIDWGRAGGE